MGRREKEERGNLNRRSQRAQRRKGGVFTNLNSTNQLLDLPGGEKLYREKTEMFFRPSLEQMSRSRTSFECWESPVHLMMTEIFLLNPARRVS